MRENPFTGDVLPLKDKDWKGVYRTSTGRYRIFFIPFHNEERIEIVSIRPRREDTYRR